MEKEQIDDIKIVLLYVLARQSGRYPNAPEALLVESAIDRLGIDITRWGKHTGI